jgi:hypothetical protein
VEVERMLEAEPCEFPHSMLFIAKGALTIGF